jgi:hypothetical protein
MPSVVPVIKVLIGLVDCLGLTPFSKYPKPSKPND